jgi:hypothetical protein
MPSQTNVNNYVARTYMRSDVTRFVVEFKGIQFPYLERKRT